MSSYPRTDSLLKDAFFILKHVMKLQRLKELTTHEKNISKEINSYRPRAAGLSLSLPQKHKEEEVNIPDEDNESNVWL